MGKKKYKYEPGELDRTRKNLGLVPPEEAKEIAQKLGGEVGYEKETSTTEEESKKPSHYIKKTSLPGKKIQPAAKKESPNFLLSPHMPYKERLKTDFHCSHMDYNIKSTGQLVASFFSFLYKGEDLVNPAFIRDSEFYFYKPLENLVTALQSLTNKKHKLAIQKIRRRPLFDQIFRTMKSWNLEEISKELARIQSDPRRVKVEDLRGLLKMVYRPIIQLEQLEIEEHLARALKRLSEFDLMALPKNSMEAQKVRKHYFVARDELFPVFYRMKKRLYPLLLKLLSSQFYYYEEFFKIKREEILIFLDLTEEDLVEPQTVIDSYNQLKEAQKGEDLPELLEPVNFIPSPLYTRGINQMEALFPESGFDQLRDDQDYLRYFHGLLDFPKGAELLPPGDPLQAILVLVSLLQNLFFGFRNIRFGTIKDEDGKIHKVQDIIMPILSKWHIYLDDMYSKEYLYQLEEYCRTLDKNTGEKEALHKQFSLLQWLRKLYFLPHISIKMLSKAPPKRISGVDPLFQVTKDLKRTLAQILLELYEREAGECQGVLNAFEPYEFSVPNPISRRLNNVIPKTLQTNKTLLSLSLIYINLLDELINRKESPFYKYQAKVPYRTNNDSDMVPSHHVPPYSVEKTFKKHINAHAHWVQELQTSLVMDPDTGFYTSFALEERLRRMVENFHFHDLDFTVISLEIRGIVHLAEEDYRSYQNIHQTISLAARKTLPGNVQPIALDDLSYLFLLSGVKQKEGEQLGEELLQELVFEAERELPAVIGILPFNALWNVAKILEMIREARSKARKLSTPVRLTYDILKNDFTYKDDYPFVEPFTKTP